MKRSAALVLIGCALTCVSAPAAGEEATRPLVGEMRMIAIAPNNQAIVAELHREGWLETRGQLLATDAFPELFKVIGRAWTSDTAAENRFGIPAVGDPLQRRASSRNPFGVLGPGDLVTSGARRQTRSSPLTCWIFAGRPVTASVAGVAGR